MNPECTVGKHRACNGDGWDQIKDKPAQCECPCHEEDRPMRLTDLENGTTDA